MLKIFLNHKKFFLFLSAIIIFFVSFLVISSPKAPKSDVLPSITPGSSTKEDVIEKLGNPISESTQNGVTLSEFKSLSPTRNNEVTFQNNKAEFFKRIIAYSQPLKIADILKIYGDTNNILYGPETVAGFYLYVYPDKGVAYLGNKNTGDLLEIWYFTPTTLQDFQTKWAQGYSSKLENQVQQ